MKALTATALVLLAAMPARPALTAGFDGSEPLVCAAIDIMSCGPGGPGGPGAECRRETAESVNGPQFLKVNVAGKSITGVRASGETLTTAIETTRNAEGKLILQGVEGPYTWTVVIPEATGRLTVTLAGEQVSFVIFGACTKS